MPRTEEANQRIRDERKEQVLQAAAGVFARRGLADTKIVDIAAAAGVSHGLAYRYFHTKEEVFAELVERSLNGVSRISEAALEQPGTPWEKLLWITRETLSGMYRRPEYTLVVLHALTNEAVPSEVRQLAMRQSEVMTRAIMRLIREGQATGQVVSGDPVQLAWLYQSCILGLAVGGNLTGLVPGAAKPPLPDAEMVLRILKHY
ncbi:MAG TPA: TetR/AcrR family transcriptional regulator [Ktedonobacterales bacterium]|nr:TetR/AcrR family transcriptional regulator [Ktedonobacterales bacterium]